MSPDSATWQLTGEDPLSHSYEGQCTLGESCGRYCLVTCQAGYPADQELEGTWTDIRIPT
uniref:Uncharacterized protein n=1 Tax=Arundo donax TaxID=35708 RepID=A0A0A8ZZS1_ARUDO